MNTKEYKMLYKRMENVRRQINQLAVDVDIAAPDMDRIEVYNLRNQVIMFMAAGNRMNDAMRELENKKYEEFVNQ